MQNVRPICRIPYKKSLRYIESMVETGNLTKGVALEKLSKLVNLLLLALDNGHEVVVESKDNGSSRIVDLEDYDEEIRTLFDKYAPREDSLVEVLK